MATQINTFTGKYFFLSNFAPARVEYNNIVYPTSEHAFQAQKSGNNRVQKIFSIVETPADAKTLGKAIRLREDWESIKDLAMFNIVYAKFKQNPDLGTKLIETGNAELIEGNTWHDDYWGVCDGVGQNKLGIILMQVRSMLKSEIFT